MNKVLIFFVKYLYFRCKIKVELKIKKIMKVIARLVLFLLGFIVYGFFQYGGPSGHAPFADSWQTHLIGGVTIVLFGIFLKSLLAPIILRFKGVR